MRWAPPQQVAPNRIPVPLNYFSTPEFRPDQDVELVLPPVPRRAGADLRVNGGRHVRIIGGHIRGRLQWTGGTGSLFVEGLRIDLTETPNRDAIVVSGAQGASPDVFLQNILVTGVQGAFKSTHADIFQPYGAVGHLRVHNFTGDTNYQGFFIRPEYPIKSATFSHVNLKFNRLGQPDGNTFLLWCRNMAGSPALGDPFFPVTYGPGVYAEANDRTPGHAAAFPPPGFLVPGPGGMNFSGITDLSGSVRWPPISGISGKVRLGPPPDGDFIDGHKVGLGYRSPGYAN